MDQKKKADSEVQDKFSSHQDQNQCTNSLLLPPLLPFNSQTKAIVPVYKVSVSLLSLSWTLFPRLLHQVLHKRNPGQHHVHLGVSYRYVNPWIWLYPFNLRSFWKEFQSVWEVRNRLAEARGINKVYRFFQRNLEDSPCLYQNCVQLLLSCEPCRKLCWTRKRECCFMNLRILLFGFLSLKKDYLLLYLLLKGLSRCAKEQLLHP